MTPSKPTKRPEWIQPKPMASANNWINNHIVRINEICTVKRSPHCWSCVSWKQTTRTASGNKCQACDSIRRHTCFSLFATHKFKTLYLHQTLCYNKYATNARHDISAWVSFSAMNSYQQRNQTASRHMMIIEMIGSSQDTVYSSG